MHALPPRMIIESLIYLAGCGLAAWIGGRAERIVSLALVAELVLGVSLMVFEPAETPHYIHLTLDLGVLAVVLYVAFTNNLRWPLVGSALQILSVLTYVVRVIDPSVVSWSFVTVGIALGYGVILTTLFGAIAYRLRRTTTGPMLQM